MIEKIEEINDLPNTYTRKDLRELADSKKQWYELWPERLHLEAKSLNETERYRDLFCFDEPDGKNLIVKGHLNFNVEYIPWEIVRLKLEYPPTYPFRHIVIFDVDNLIPPAPDNHKSDEGNICTYFAGSGHVNPRNGDTLVKVLDTAVWFFIAYAIKCATGSCPIYDEPHSKELAILKYVLKGKNFGRKDFCPCQSLKNYEDCHRNFVKNNLSYAKRRMKQLKLTPEKLVFDERFWKFIKQ